MKSQSLFSGRIRKYLTMSSADILPIAKDKLYSKKKLNLLSAQDFVLIMNNDYHFSVFI